MCGRMNVTDSPLSQWVSESFGINFKAKTNTDLRPSQTVDVLSAAHNQLQQCSTKWGIKPEWSKRLIINAQAETVAEKKTFKQAFSLHRCLIPCSGWYEWRAEKGAKKTKYLFTQVDKTPLLMAGICFERPLGGELVTLTTASNAKCAEIHKRMPVLIAAHESRKWLFGCDEQVAPMLRAVCSNAIKIEVVDD